MSYVYVCVSVCPNVRISVYVRTSLYICLSVCLAICLFVCLSVYVCASLCLSVPVCGCLWLSVSIGLYQSALTPFPPPQLSLPSSPGHVVTCCWPPYNLRRECTPWRMTFLEAGRLQDPYRRRHAGCDSTQVHIGCAFGVLPCLAPGPDGRRKAHRAHPQGTSIDYSTPIPDHKSSTVITSYLVFNCSSFVSESRSNRYSNIILQYY